MWRAFFSGIGIVLVIFGVECLLIDSAVLASGVVDDPMPIQNAGLFGAAQVQQVSNRVFRPAEWFPWSLLASGAIVILYAVSIPKNPS